MRVATLAEIQAALSRLYDIELPERVEDFVCDAEVARAVGVEVERREVLVVVEEANDVLVGLYLDPEAVNRLAEATDPMCPERFAAYCLVAEGVSHFVYLMYRLSYEEAVSQLELEVQAEVDKYATALLAGQGMGACLTLADEKRAYVLADRGTWLAFRRKLGLEILVEGAETLRTALAGYRAKAEYPETALGRKLQLLARIIVSGFGTRLFHVNFPGFDTHATQLPAHQAEIGGPNRHVENDIG